MEMIYHSYEVTLEVSDNQMVTDDPKSLIDKIH
jgi:hypothetical protein